MHRNTHKEQHTHIHTHTPGSLVNSRGLSIASVVVVRMSFVLSALCFATKRRLVASMAPRSSADWKFGLQPDKILLTTSAQGDP